MIVDVALGAKSYAVVVERGVLATVGARLKPLGVGSRAAIITSASILRLYGKPVTESLEDSGF